MDGKLHLYNIFVGTITVSVYFYLLVDSKVLKQRNIHFIFQCYFSDKLYLFPRYLTNNTMAKTRSQNNKNNANENKAKATKKTVEKNKITKPKNAQKKRTVKPKNDRKKTPEPYTDETLDMAICDVKYEHLSCRQLG